MGPPLRTVKLADDDGHPLGIDGDARGAIMLDIHHDKVHDGEAYVVSTIFSGIGASGAAMLFKLPNTTTKYHTQFSVFGDDAGVVEVFENPTYTTGSTDTPAFCYNQNRTSTNSSKVLVYSQVQYTSGSGSNIWLGRLGTSNPKVTSGGDITNNYEWVFQSGTVLVKYTPVGAGKLSAIRAAYYEVA